MRLSPITAAQYTLDERAKQLSKQAPQKTADFEYIVMSTVEGMKALQEESDAGKYPMPQAQAEIDEWTEEALQQMQEIAEEHLSVRLATHALLN